MMYKKVLKSTWTCDIQLGDCNKNSNSHEVQRFAMYCEERLHYHEDLESHPADTQFGYGPKPEKRNTMRE